MATSSVPVAGRYTTLVGANWNTPDRVRVYCAKSARYRIPQKATKEKNTVRGMP